VEVVYTIGTSSRTGIGLTASKGIEGLERAGVLKDVITPTSLGENPPQGDVEFDARAAQVLEQLDFDVFCGWNNMSLEQLKIAEKKGAGSVVIRASTHPAHQQKVLREECARLGLNLDMVPDETVKRCEYEFMLASKILVPTAFVAKTMMDNGVDSEKLFIACHGVDLDQYKPRWEMKSENFKCIYVGPNVIRKGLFYLLKAWEKVPEGWLDVAPLSNIPVSGLKYTVKNPVWPTGHIPDLNKHFADMHVLCLPTLEEGQALVLLEAAAAGLALVTTAASGALEIFEAGKSCIIVPPRDPDAISNALNYLRAEPEVCKQMGLEARKAIQKYPWSRYGDAVAQVCQESRDA